MKNNFVRLIFGTATIVITGCSEPDGRLANLAEKATAEQAEQNRNVMKASGQLIEANQKLTERDAAARRELIELQQHLRQDQAEVERQRDRLETERQAIAVDRQRESTWGSLFLSMAFVLAALAPLVLAGMALWIAWQSPADQACADVLVEELASQSSLLRYPSPDPPRLENQVVTHLRGRDTELPAGDPSN